LLPEEAVAPVQEFKVVPHQMHPAVLVKAIQHITDKMVKIIQVMAVVAVVVAVAGMDQPVAEAMAGRVAAVTLLVPQGPTVSAPATLDLGKIQMVDCLAVLATLTTDPTRPWEDLAATNGQAPVGKQATMAML
jgi:hypothetical protein